MLPEIRHPDGRLFRFPETSLICRFFPRIDRTESRYAEKRRREDFRHRLDFRNRRDTLAESQLE